MTKRSREPEEINIYAGDSEKQSPSIWIVLLAIAGIFLLVIYVVGPGVRDLQNAWSNFWSNPLKGLGLFILPLMAKLRDSYYDQGDIRRHPIYFILALLGAFFLFLIVFGIALVLLLNLHI